MALKPPNDITLNI